jgi:L-ribulose-5-phosphate 4-epimerase
MTLTQLKAQVCEANRALETSGLVKLTWGNVSGMDRENRRWAIKPSGVSYAGLKPAHIVVLDLEGRVIEGRLRPSSDTLTHLVLYQECPGIGGITHTHSTYATMFCQAGREIPCLGTTHADHFHGPIPVVRALRPREVEQGYEHHTGLAIVEELRTKKINPVETPGVLQLHHAPFAFGHDALDSLKNAIALEMCAQMAFGSLALRPGLKSIPAYIQEKHFRRKHGPNAYYGQK